LSAGRSKGSDSADLERAMTLLEGAKRPSFSDVESNFLFLYRPHSIAWQALCIGELAVKNNDVLLSNRALNLMRRYETDADSNMEYRRKELQATIDAMTAPKPPSAVDLK
jgi:hypothetical protein